MGKAKHKIFNTEEAIIDRVVDKNEMVIDTKKTCESINNYFINKITNLKAKLKPQEQDPIKNYNSYIKTPTKLLTLKEIDINQLTKIFSKIKKSNSASADGITGNMLKIIKNSILPLILNLVGV